MYSILYHFRVDKQNPQKAHETTCSENTSILDWIVFRTRAEFKKKFGTLKEPSRYISFLPVSESQGGLS